LKLVPLALLALTLIACQSAPEGGWGPVADVGAEAVRIVPADGQPRTITVLGGGTIVQPVPAPDGSGFTLAGQPPCPGSLFGPVTLRTPTTPRPDGTRLFVDMPFTLQTDGAILLDCYVRRFAAKGITSQRDGNILNASLPEGHLTIAINPDAAAAPASALATGEMRLRRS
jgi:hypothetical protein